MLRRATEDFNLGGRHIHKGWVLRVTPWVLQRDARNFPDPLRFMPQHFNLSLPAQAQACVPKLKVTLRPEGAVPVMLTRRIHHARQQAQVRRLQEALAALECVN